jgi:hypothetical protein
MSVKYGWEFWINHNGRIRQFIVAHENEETARGIVETLDPNVTGLNFVSKQHMPWNVIEMLGLAEGAALEFQAVPEPRNALPIQGYDQGALVEKPNEN